MARVEFERSSGNVFADVGFAAAEAAELTAKSNLIIAVKDTIASRHLTQKEAARLCGTDQPTLSKVLRGRMDSVTIDRLAGWLTALGRDVEIVVKPAAHQPPQGRSPAAINRTAAEDRFAALQFAHRALAANWRDAVNLASDRELPAKYRQFYKRKAVEFRAEMTDLAKKIAAAEV